MSRKKEKEIQQEIADLLGVSTSLPDEGESIEPVRGARSESDSDSEVIEAGRGHKPLRAIRARNRPDRSIKSIVKLMVMMNKLQEFRNRINVVLTERIESLRDQIEILIRKAGVSPLKKPHDRMLYGDASVKFVDRSIRLLQDGKVLIKEKVIEERFQMKADMTYLPDFNPAPVLEWAREHKPNLIETQETKTLDFILLEESIRNGRVPKEVALATAVILEYSQKTGLLEHSKEESLDYNYYKQLVKNDEIPTEVVKEATKTGTYRVTIHRPLKLADRCQSCGEILKIKSSDKSIKCPRCGLVNKSYLVKSG